MKQKRMRGSEIAGDMSTGPPETNSRRRTKTYPGLNIERELPQQSGTPSGERESTADGVLSTEEAVQFISLLEKHRKERGRGQEQEPGELIELRRYAPGDYVIQEGEVIGRDAPAEGYVLVQGSCFVFQKDQLGRQHLIGCITENELFGEVALISLDGTRSASVRVSLETSAKIAVFPRGCITGDGFNIGEWGDGQVARIVERFVKKELLLKSTISLAKLSNTVIGYLAFHGKRIGKETLSASWTDCKEAVCAQMNVDQKAILKSIDFSPQLYVSFTRDEINLYG